VNAATPHLKTARLSLAPLREVDSDEMARVLADPALYAFTGGEPPDPQGLRERYARLVVGHSSDGAQIWHNWIVRTTADGAAIGTVQATVSSEEPTAEIAWVIGVPWQGRGYATEAAQALVAWLEAIGMGTIVARIHPEHGASATIASRAGLHPTAELEEGERVWRLSLQPGAPGLDPD
jgi:RimJ/RimL family protein N-acetyltransferase